MDTNRLARITGAALIALALALPPPASAAEGARPPTPRLLEQAVARGDLSRFRADLYLVYALGGDPRLPAAYRSSTPWDGTLPLLHLRRRVRSMDPGAQRSQLEQAIEAQALSSCGGETGGANTLNTTHFHIEYGTIGGGLTAVDYGNSLQTSWTTEVTTFGWAAPPLSPASPLNGTRYLVVVANFGPGSGLYGFVTSTGAPLNGNNPNTPWADGDARFSCMALNRDYSGFPSSPQDSLDATTAHEFNHSLQYGYGALNGMVPADDFVEGGATWMEDEVFDGSNDNYNYLWPNFADGMDGYGGSPYPYWITFRGLTERYGTGTAGGGEQVMEDFWEQVSQNLANNSAALSVGLQNKGATLPAAFHAYAVAVKFNRACGGGYVYPYCFEEGPQYVASAGATAVHKSIGSVGGSAVGKFEGLALNWVQIPKNVGTYKLTLKNTGTSGVLRGSAVCDTGTGLEVNAFPGTVAGGASTTLDAFDSSGCTSAVAVLTADGGGGRRTKFPYQLTTATGGGGGSSSLSIGDAQVTEGDTGSKSLVFTVTLSPSSAGTVTVDYATQTPDRGATAGTDFASAGGTLTFTPGDTSETIGVTVFGDTLTERDEAFSVVLSNAAGATIADGTGVGTILNDD